MPTLDWLNRAAAFDVVKRVPYRLLELVSEHHSSNANEVQPDNAQSNLELTPETSATAIKPTHDNLLIQGDNLEALKALLPFYRGQVKCIFIDPPYNTKSAFEHYDDNLEHSQWLSMMLPRLQLLRELLREDGSIWVTIDDNEGHYLKVMMDEVFGRKNFVVNVTWQKRVSPANDAKYFSSDHDNALVYARDKQTWKLNRLERTETQNAFYKNPDHDSRGDWNSVTYTGNKTRTERPNLYYAITNPNTGESVYPPDTLTWRYGEETHRENEMANLLYWGKTGASKVPRLKMFLSNSEAVVPRSVWLYSDAGSTQQSMTEQKNIFEDPFATPKPELLVQRIIHIGTKPGDLVLDSFLGSGTTAAVAQKMGRRWIGIEMGQHANTHCLPRLKKVIDGEQGGISKAVNWTGGGSFRYMKLGTPIFDDNGAIHPNVRFATLASFIWMQETRKAMPKKKTGASPLLGIDNGVAYYLLFNGILGDRRPQGGNVLTRAILDWLTVNYPHNGPRVVYGESVRVGPDRLTRDNVMFRTIPHDIKAR
jgi:adenine-specific DNA-methyltransferase